MRGAEMGVSYPYPVNGQSMPLYVHVPFCESLCPFCPFHRILLDEALADAYFTLLEGQLERLAAIGYRFSELCVGGGTPTTRPLALQGLIRKATSLWDLDQITVETNPNHLKREILEPLRQVGVSRLSVGVQSLHDHRLKHLGRLEAYGGRDRILSAIAQNQGLFDTFNVDMIFNLPGQTMEELVEDVALLKATGVDQISYHPLMPTDENLRDQSDFGRVDFKQESAMYRQIVDGLAPEYRMGSVWCFNRKPQLIDEYFVYNLNYLGIGSGAFSLMDGCFYTTSFDIQRYMESCRSGGDVFEQRYRLGPVVMHAYRLLTRLFGVSVPVAGMTDLRFSVWMLRAAGMLQRTHDRYQLTARGRGVWLILMRRFFMAVNRFRQQKLRGEDVECPFTVRRVLLRLVST